MCSVDRAERRLLFLSCSSIKGAPFPPPPLPTLAPPPLVVVVESQGESFREFSPGGGTFRLRAEVHDDDDDGVQVVNFYEANFLLKEEKV